MKRHYVILLVVCAVLAGLWWFSGYLKQDISEDEFIAEFNKKVAEENVKRERELEQVSEQVLDKEFISSELGFSVKYPSTFYEYECKRLIPVTVKVVGNSAQFFKDPVSGQAMCGDNPSIASIDSYPARTEREVLKIATTKFGENCVAKLIPDPDRSNAYIVAIREKVHDYPGPAVECYENLTWNKKTGILIRNSSFGLNNGGQMLWFFDPKAKLPPGWHEPIDYLITRSIRFLEK